MRRGDIWWANLDPPWGRRPVALLARDEAYRLLSGVAVAPLTTADREVLSWVPLDPDADHVPRRSAINLDSIQTIPASRLDQFITRLRPHKAEELDRAIHFALGVAHCPRLL